VDVSDKMTADGRLDWTRLPALDRAPLGYTILNKACPDFFSREALDHHLRQSVEKLIPLAGQHVGKPDPPARGQLRERPANVDAGVP